VDISSSLLYPLSGSFLDWIWFALLDPDC
jgi:hypothetical protein